MGTELKLLLAKLLASMPLITRLLLVPRCPLTKTVEEARPAVAASGNVELVFAFSANKFVKLRVAKGSDSKVLPGSTLPSVELVVFTWVATAFTSTAEVVCPISSVTFTCRTTVTSTLISFTMALLKPFASTISE